MNNLCMSFNYFFLASFRKSTLHSALTSETWNDWPSVTCEKLFYDNHTVVNAVSNPVTDIALGKSYMFLFALCFSNSNLVTLHIENIYNGTSGNSS